MGAERDTERSAPTRSELASDIPCVEFALGCIGEIRPY